MMGLGIVALSLWLLLGIQFYYNQISLFPEVVSLMILAIGLCVVLKKIKLKEFKISIVLVGIEMILIIFFNKYNSLILLLLLSFIFIGIDKIAEKYVKINKYRKEYKIYLICLLLINILGYTYEKTLEDFLIKTATFIFIVSFIILCMIIYHIVKINQSLEDEYFDLEIVSSNSHRKILIMLILSCISIGGLIYIKDDFIDQVHQEVHEKEIQYFKVDKADYKLTPFGYQSHRTTTLMGQGEITSSFNPKLFVRNDLVKHLSKVKYTIADGEKVILESYDIFEKIEYDKEGNDYGHNPFEGYTAGYLNSDMDDFYDYMNDNKVELVTLTLEFFDKNDHCYYKDQSPIEEVLPTIYHYEDENILIENFQYDMNTLIGYPEVKVKTKNIQTVSIYYQDENEDFVILQYWINENNQFELIYTRHFFNTPIKELKPLKVVCYDSDDQVINETLCHMEVLP